MDELFPGLRRPGGAGCRVFWEIWSSGLASELSTWRWYWCWNLECRREASLRWYLMPRDWMGLPRAGCLAEQKVEDREKMDKGSDGTAPDAGQVLDQYWLGGWVGGGWVDSSRHEV